MSHCVNVVVSKEALKNSLKFNDAYITLRNNNNLENTINYVVISTDYFGGCGKQSCILVEGGKQTSYNQDDSINQTLEKLGFVNENPSIYSDLFEWVGLHTFRSNERLEEKIKSFNEQYVIEDLKIDGSFYRKYV